MHRGIIIGFIVVLPFDRQTKAQRWARRGSEMIWAKLRRPTSGKRNSLLSATECFQVLPSAL